MSKYNGERLGDFPEFWEKFRLAVDTDEELEASWKLLYLKESL